MHVLNMLKFSIEIWFSRLSLGLIEMTSKLRLVQSIRINVNSHETYSANSVYNFGHGRMREQK